MSKKLLLDEYPLLVMPTLACRVGLFEAIFLQQLHYWLINVEQSRLQEPERYARHYRDGRIWIYNTLQGWGRQFAFVSTKTLQRAIKKLVSYKLVLTGNFNRARYDQTRWYSIDYDALYKFLDTRTANPRKTSFGQIVQIEMDNLTRRYGQIVQMDTDKLTRPIPEISEISTENNTTETALVDNSDAVVVELKKFGLTAAAINEILDAVDQTTASQLVQYAHKNRLGAGWLRSAARDPAKRPPPVNEAAISHTINKPCPKCNGQGWFIGQAPLGNGYEMKSIVITCDCVKPK